MVSRVESYCVGGLPTILYPGVCVVSVAKGCKNVRLGLQVDGALGLAGVSGQVRIIPLHLVRSFDFSRF